MCERIACHCEKIASLKTKMKQAMLYPVAVLCVALAVTAVLLIFVVPQFEQLFASFGAQLPLFTQLVLNFSHIMQNYCLFIASLLIGIIYLLSKFKHSNLTVKTVIDKYTLKTYIIGELLKSSIITRFTRTLATTVSSGMPLLDSLAAAAKITGNIVYANAIQQIANNVTTGTSLFKSMSATQLFPDIVLQMIAIGEEAGTLESMLTKIANIYEQEVDTKINMLSSMIEPIIIITLGILIGGLITAMYLPIFQMGQVIG